MEIIVLILGKSIVKELSDCIYLIYYHNFFSSMGFKYCAV